MNVFTPRSNRFCCGAWISRQPGRIRTQFRCGSRLPEIRPVSPQREFRRKVRSDWADANRPGAPTDCFIEGPSFDADGNLFIVDIPFGRIFRISPDRKWTLVIEYEGWPNGLKIDARGRIEDRVELLRVALGRAIGPQQRVLRGHRLEQVHHRRTAAGDDGPCVVD